MGRFAPLLPELILSIGGTILMMVAAFTGRRGAGLTSWLAIALLLGATVALIGAPSHAGPIFDGIITADLFGAFGKADHVPRRRGSDHRGARLVRARDRAWQPNMRC